MRRNYSATFDNKSYLQTLYAVSQEPYNSELHKSQSTCFFFAPFPSPFIQVWETESINSECNYIFLLFLFVQTVSLLGSKQTIQFINTWSSKISEVLKTLLYFSPKSPQQIETTKKSQQVIKLQMLKTGTVTKTKRPSLYCDYIHWTIFLA